MNKEEKDAIKASLGEIDRELENARGAAQALEGEWLYNNQSSERGEAEEELDTTSQMPTILLGRHWRRAG